MQHVNIETFDSHAGIPGLEDPDLLRHQGLLEGWSDADSGMRFGVYNPVNNELIIDLPRMAAAETARAIDTAQAAFADWAAIGIDARASVLCKWADLIRHHSDDIGRILTTEEGKPLAEATGEVLYSATFVDWFANEAARPSGEMIPPHTADTRMLVTREPIGVGAAITPWNFPAAMVTRKVAPALAAGCPIVMKPAEDAPLTALALAELALRAGIPPGVLQLVTGDREDAARIGEEIMRNPIVRKISFTGSTEVGKQLMAQAAATAKRISMELGGNAPFIVFDDADLDAAVAGLIGAKYRNAGQTCVSANRIYLQRGIHDEFVDKLVAATAALTVGDGLVAGTDVGPLINQAGIEKVERHIEDAVARGGTIVCGGKRHELGGCFFEPTVMIGVAADAQACCEETFGPLATIVSFDDEQAVIAMANDTPYGLAAYFYSTNRTRCWRVAEALQAGIVCENTAAFSSARAPFGGFKESGVGREGGALGLHEWTETKYRCIGSIQ
jgi:succinate-semialdehyde dehydrogenase/glutarate-semialdehyde dehydrogenase